MKEIIIFSIYLFFNLFYTLQAQSNRQAVLENLERDSQPTQENVLTAKLKQATRLFEFKDDLTSVIEVLPAGISVIVTGSDEDYYKVKYDDYEGYIFKKHADLEMTQPENIEVPEQEARQQEDARENEPAREMTRFEYLEKKYGTRLAAQMNAGKIWKGMTSQMVLDSWGQPQKINRSVSGNISREEWIYRNTWLFIENNILIDWGPIRK